MSTQPVAIAGRSTAAAVVIQYCYLQFLDVLTTLAFLLKGVQEANPLVRFALQVAPNPLVALLAVKAVAVALCLVCWRSGRMRVLKRVNALFAMIVLWNLWALVAWSAHVA